MDMHLDEPWQRARERAPAAPEPQLALDAIGPMCHWRWFATLLVLAVAAFAVLAAAVPVLAATPERAAPARLLHADDRGDARSGGTRREPGCAAGNLGLRAGAAAASTAR